MAMFDRRKTLAITDTSYSFNAAQKGTWREGRFAILTAGDDTQGMNAAVRGAARMGIYLGCRVFYIKNGFKGMVEGGENIVEAFWKDTSGILGVGGTILKSYKCPEFMERAGRLKAAKSLIERGIQHIVAIGGDGTMKGINTLYSEWASLIQELDSKSLVEKNLITRCRQLKVICILASIMNDVWGTDYSIGVNSALHRIQEAIDAIETTSSSAQLAFVVQVMGTTSGLLALATGLLFDASMTFIPEWPPEGNWRDVLCDKVKDDIILGSEGILCVTCEGSIDDQGRPITPEEVRDTLVARLNLNAKITVLGHIQRGGAPSAFDRLLASRMAVEAVCALKDIPFEEGPSVMIERGTRMICLPLSMVLEYTDKIATYIHDRNYAEAVKTRGKMFQEMLGAYKQMHALRSSPLPCSITPTSTKVGIIRLGRSHSGQCLVNKAIVAYCHSKNITALAFIDGFHSVVERKFVQMCWKNVKRGEQKERFCLGSSLESAAEVGIDKIANALDELDLSGLILVGSFVAYQSLVEIHETKDKHRSLCIPICMVPVALVNNIPGSDITIGADTALNEIVTYCDKLKRVAHGKTNRVFVIETMDQNCGFLATVSGLTVGADAAYIKQEYFNLDTLLLDAEHIRKKILNSGVSVGLIIRSETANENFNMDFIHKLFSEEGKGVYTCRASTIGHVQVGGVTSVIDRLKSIAAGLKAMDWLANKIEALSEAGTDSNLGAIPRFVLCFVKAEITFTPVSRLIAETNFKEKLPTYLPWMKLRPLLRILAQHEDEEYSMDFLEENGSEGESSNHLKYPVDV